MTIRRGDILWADLGMFPTTSVQGGVRPVIVVSNNKANTYSSVITVVPLTSRIYKKRYLPTHVFISKYDMTGIRKGRDIFLNKVGNPYLVRIGNMKVKVRFANNGISMEQAFENMLLSV